ncbi:MAG: hypothetical protein Q7S05_03690 [bacterium]|nr:hypothetical protein [bacterium]
MFYITLLNPALAGRLELKAKKRYSAATSVALEKLESVNISQAAFNRV